jgi:hypothetical protein
MKEVAELITYGPWQIAVAVTHALCEDGRRRYAKITAQPDTFFSIPAQVKVQGKSVSGFITGREREDGASDYEFIAYAYGRNAALLKKESN